MKLLPISLTEEPLLHFPVSLLIVSLAQTEVKDKDTVIWTEPHLSETQGGNTDFTNRFRLLLSALCAPSSLTEETE